MTQKLYEKEVFTGQYYNHPDYPVNPVKINLFISCLSCYLVKSFPPVNYYVFSLRLCGELN